MANRNDVAKLAGVSPAVVSYVLNDSNYVSEEKRKAVHEAIKALDYRPNFFATALKKESGRHLLFVSESIRNELLLEMAHEMEEYAFEKGYFVSFSSCSSDKIPTYLDALLTRRCDGIFIANSMFNAEQLAICAQYAPTVLFQTKHFENLPANISVVTADIADGMELLVRHLVDEKHYQKLFYIASTYTRLMPDEKRPYGDGLRLSGFLNAAERRGMQLGSDVIYVYRDLERKEDPALLVALVDQAIAQVNPHERTAFVVANDAEAVRCIALLQKRGFQVPRDIAVMGFGGSASGEMINPALTTVAYPKIDIAKAGVDILTAGASQGNPSCVRFPMTLIQREST